MSAKFSGFSGSYKKEAPNHGKQGAVVPTQPQQAVSLYVQSPLPCKDLLGSIPNPLTVQHPPGAALQPHDSVDLNKIAA
jgi:hypothetical protein